MDTWSSPLKDPHLPPPTYRLCAIDLDDTLLGPDHKISPANAAAIRATVERGVIVVLASGRMHAATVKYAVELGLDTPIISYNGALVRMPDSGETLLEESVPPPLADTVLDYCAARPLQLNYYWNDLLYSARDTQWLELYRSRTGSPTVIERDLYTAFRSKSPTKLIIVDTPTTTDGLLPYFRGVFGSKLYVTKSNDEYLEFMPAAANKGAALAAVAAKYGVKQAETVAFGDSWNDIPMLTWAGLGIAVANAKSEARAAADRIVPAAGEDGVAAGLSQLFLQNG